ncbi:MAG: hypothetical protein ACOC2W_01985 [bacterium]
MSERSIVFVTGSKVEGNEAEKRHTAICGCGNRIVAAKKESSLDYYIDNEKWKAKCCGSKLHYAGENEFANGELVENKESTKSKKESAETPVVKEKLETAKKPTKEIDLPIIDIDLESGKKVDLSEVLDPGPRGVSKTTLINAMEEYQDDEVKLIAMYQAYPEDMKDCAERYVIDPIRAKVERAIQKVDENFTVENIGPRMRKKMANGKF